MNIEMLMSLPSLHYVALFELAINIDYGCPSYYEQK